MPSLSRIYRPKTFSGVTGQAPVVQTLKQELTNGRLGHAYLFFGPRGVGKTTTARIFARALNCADLQNGEPCNRCTSCVSSLDNRCLDIIELDAATHTGVDMIREAIIEHVRFSPVSGKCKVYILDEAHMLSASSWNALLKTLEEPPVYAFFILATTEWHKVPTTVLSRCQRFEFRRLKNESLTARLRWLADQEGWTVEEDVIRLVVSRSEGCLRDAETLFGQLGALGPKKIDMDLARLLIPEQHQALALDFLKLWTSHDAEESLKRARALFDDGVPMLPLFDDLLTAIRLLVSAVGDEEQLSSWQFGLPEEQSLAALSRIISPEELSHMALLLMERRREVKMGVDPLFALQLVCIQLSAINSQSSNQACQNPSTSAGRQSEAVESRELIVDSHQNSQTENEASRKILTKIQLTDVHVKWPVFVRAVEEKNCSLSLILKICQPVCIQDETLVIRFQYPFHREKLLNDIKHRRVVEECAREIFHPSIRIEGVIEEEPTRVEERKQDVVGNILKAFGGSVVEG